MVLTAVASTMMSIEFSTPAPIKQYIQIRNSNFSGTEQFFPGTQAFASPPDMASGGLAKACVPGKNFSVPEKFEFLIEYQTE